MSPSIKKNNTKLNINDLPAEILLMIFDRSHPVACYRARMVCRRWRDVIDKIDEETRKVTVGDGHARLFVCDRRRAIVEKFASLPSCSNSVRDLIATRKSVFYEDRYAHTALSSWAYRFDLTQWSTNFDIVEVWVQNFGSFLERDQASFGDGPMFLANSGLTAVTGADKSGSFGATPPMQTTPSRQLGRSPHSHRSGGSSGSLGSGVVPYNMLPSSQCASTESIAVNVELNEETCQELTDLSAGRFERLVSQLRAIQPLHVVFNDHSLYQKRPTLLLFWFLKQLPNLRKLTLDCVQGIQAVELHRAISIQGIDELTVIQPQQNACIVVTENLLNAFLEVPRAERRRFRLRFKGKTALSADSICNFIKKWQNHRDVIRFRTILIDALSVRPADFVRATMCGGDSNNNEVRKEDSNADSAALACKQLFFRHRRSDVRIKYKYEDGYLVFTYFDPKQPLTRRSHSESEVTPKVVSFYSPPPTPSSSASMTDDEGKEGGGPLRELRTKARAIVEEENFFRKFFNLFLRGTA